MGLRGPNSRSKGGSGGRSVDVGKWRKAYSTDGTDGKSRADRVIEWIEKLRVTSGALAGEPFRLRDWQRKIVRAWYATDGRGLRIVRVGLLSVARKNGKSGLCAALGLCHLLGPEQEPRGQIVVGATDRDQSGVIFDEVVAFINDNPEFLNECNIKRHEKTIEHLPSGSKLRALSSDAKKAHGLSPSVVILDELAQWGDGKGRDLYDALSTGSGARKEPLRLIISTQAPKDHSLMSTLVDYANKVNAGTIKDAQFSGFVFEIPIELDVFDEANWPLANPALDDFRSLEDMRELAEKAQRMPTLEGTFRNLFCNQRWDAQVKFMPKALWDLCGGELPEGLAGYYCFGALDLSGTGGRDLLCFLLVFVTGSRKVVVPFFWMAEGRVEEAERRDEAPYTQWIAEGHITAVPGNTFDYRFIAQQIGEISVRYPNIQYIAVDPWNIERMTNEMDELGLNLAFQKHQQTCSAMETGIGEIENDVLSRKLLHNGNPVLWDCLDNVKVTMDSSGNRKFDKRKATGRIDGAVALAMAESIAAVHEPEPSYAVTDIY